MALEDLNFKINVDNGDLKTSFTMLGLVEAGLGKVTAAGTSLTGVKKNLEGMSNAAGNVQFNLGAVSTSMTAAAVAAKPLALISGKLGILSRTFGLAATGASYLAAAASLVVSVFKYMYVGLEILLKPLYGIVIAARLIIGAFKMMFAVVIAPFKILISAVGMVFRGMMSVLGPVLAVAAAFFRLKLMIMSLKLQFVIIQKVLEFLPPRLRLLVVGLVALGAAGRVGAFAMRIAATAASVFGGALTVARIAAMALVNPVGAAKLAITSLGSALYRVTTAAYGAAAGMVRFAATSAVSGMKSLGSAVGRVATSIGGALISAVKTGVTMLGALGAATVAWGVKMAAGAETATVVFGTMLKNMAQGKALMRELEGWKGASLFDPKQVQDAGRDLFKAGVPVTQLIGRLDQLGNIAVATKTPIEDLTRIYRQGMARGSFQTDLVNQMAERGIDIYHALEAVTGKSGEALATMMQDGKLGAIEMNAAIAHMTEGTGIYAGAIGNVAQTTEGLWQAMKTNIGLAARDIGQNVISAFDFKGLLAQGSALFTTLRTEIASAMPAFMAVAIVVKAAFGAIWEVVTVVFSAITAALGVTGSNWLTSFVEWAAVAAFAFKNWPSLAELAFVQLALGLVQAGNQFSHFFTGVIPALLTWFGDNWQNVFWSALDLASTVFINLGTNIRSFFTGIWNFIKSGGTNWEVAWVPLTEGFKSALTSLPNIPERAITDLEKQLQADSARLGSALSVGLSDEIASNLQMLDQYQTQQANAVNPALVDQAGKQVTGAEGTGAASASKKVSENKAALARSAEGQTVAAQFLKGMGKTDSGKAALKAAETTAAGITRLVREVEQGKPLRKRAFATG